RLAQRVDDEAAQQLRADRMEPELEAGDDAEIAAAALQRPEQVGMRRGARPTSPAAVTTSADSRLSTVIPCLRLNQPNPPPRVSPAMPVVELIPTGVA